MVVFQRNGLKFAEDANIISCEEFVKTIKFFDKNLLVGAELERTTRQYYTSVASLFGVRALSYGVSHNDSVVSSLYKSARSSNKYNVAFVTTDSSVDDGNEILYGGNVEGFRWNYKKLKMIESVLTENGCADYHHSTSTHISLLTSYNRNLSPLILKNVWNIVRAFSSALYWLGSGDRQTIVRSGVRSYAKPINHLTPASRTAKQLSEAVGKFHIVRLDKQEFTHANGKEFLDGLFLEFRNVDGIRSPAVISSLMTLYRALIYKAVELSMTGVVQVEKLSSDWQMNKVISSRLGGASGEVMSLHKDFMKSEAKRLINFLSVYLKRDDCDTLKVLYAIAERPFSMRGLRESSEKYDSAVYVKEKELNDKQSKLLEIVAQANIQAGTLKEWKEKVARELNCSVRYVEKMMIATTEYTRLPLVFDANQKMMRFG